MTTNGPFYFERPRNIYKNYAEKRGQGYKTRTKMNIVTPKSGAEFVVVTLGSFHQEKCRPYNVVSVLIIDMHDIQPLNRIYLGCILYHIRPQG